MDVRIEREISKSGMAIVKVNDLYLHSKYNPLNEAERFLENEYKPHHLHIVFGYGLGYVVDALIGKLHFNEPILVLDPLVDNQQLNITNNTYKRLYYANLSNTGDVVNMMDQLSSYSTNVHVITSMNYDKLFPEQLKNVLELVKNNHFKQGSNAATAKHFAISWQENLLLNTQNLKEDISLESLKKAYTAPIVIAAGGPSLTKQLDLIKENRNGVILICAGSTINALLAHDIIPDYVVSVDGGEPNAEHFKGLKFSKGVSLIYGPTNHYNVRKSFEGTCYGFIPSVKPQYQHYFKNRFSKKLPLIHGGGSVAHYALSIAKYITTGPIALIGQDLALTNNQSHANGVKGNSDTTNLSDDEKYYVEGYYGEQVATTQQLRIMLNSFNEPPLLEGEHKNVWNCTEGGARIKSIAQIPFEKFLEQHVNEVVIKVEHVESKNHANGLEVFLQKEVESYTRILKLLAKGIQIIEQSVGQKLTKEELNKIGKLEKEVNRLYKKYCMETLLEPIFDRCSQEYLPKVNETELEANLRAKKYVLDLYTSSMKQIEQFIEQLNLKGE